MSFGSRQSGGRGRGKGRGSSSRPSGPRLPSTLMEEVDQAFGSSSRNNAPRLRKEARKAARRNVQGPISSQRRNHIDNSNNEQVEPLLEPSAKAKGKRPAAPESEQQHKKSKIEVKVNPPKKDKTKRPKDELRLPGEGGGDAEDREIAWLEYMLEKEKKGEDDLSDGLDDLLDFTDQIGPGGKGMYQNETGSDENSGESSDEEEETSESGSETGYQDKFPVDEEDELHINEVYATGAVDDIKGQDGAEEIGESHASEDVDVKTDEVSLSASSSRYLPPHLRAAQLAERAAGDGARALERIKLERKSQGLLNKLSEGNIDSILGEIERLFSDNSRNDVSTTLTTLVIQTISDKANLLDSFVVLYAMLIGALHRVVGIEFGAHFVQTLVQRYNIVTIDDKVPDQEPSKEALNLLTLIAELYNAGVVGSALVYDLIRGFIGTTEADVMSERSVEGLLKILKCCGSQLRVDDPASLKDIVSLVQERTRGKDKEMTTRARFMVETLVGLRGGKSKGLGAERDDVARMRRYLSGLGKRRRLLASEPLHVSLMDLLKADSRGKWWLIGAGWSGNPLVERAETLVPTSGTTAQRSLVNEEREEEEVLLELARQQGMNTDVRRSVFVVLLTSEDYVHACDRLSAFRLTDVQQREFVRVALHCCGMEKSYNPYYTLVLNHLCANSYDHRFTLQYALWDLLRELGEGGISSSRGENVARAVAYLIARGSLDLTVLKTVEFTDISKGTGRFLTNMLRGVLIGTQTMSPLFTLAKAFNVEQTDSEAVADVFDRALSNPELAGGLTWLLQDIKKNSAKGLGEREALVVRRGAEVALGVLAKAI